MENMTPFVAMHRLTRLRASCPRLHLGDMALSVLFQAIVLITNIDTCRPSAIQQGVF